MRSLHLGFTVKIYTRIESEGFEILAAKLIKMSKKMAESFYLIHKDKPFYNELTEFMSSGKCVVLALQKDNAVVELRKLIGATNPELAENDTIRKLYATNLSENAVHGSDSINSAKREIEYFFSPEEILNK